VNVRQKDVARRSDNANIVLNMQGDLKVVPPVVPRMTVVRQHRIIEEDTQSVEVVPQAVKDVYLGKSVTETTVTKQVDGVPHRVLNTELIDQLESSGLGNDRPDGLLIRLGPLPTLLGSPEAGLDDDTFVVLEKWDSMETLIEHIKAPHMVAYTADTRDWIASKTIHILQPAQ